MTRLYTGTHKQWDHTGYVVPEVEHSEGKYPSIEAHPANWLPVQRLDTKVEEYTVIAAGKVVALDRQGNVVPAGLKYVFEEADGAPGTTILTYTANDYERGTVDLTTGSAYATNGTTNYDQGDVTDALQARGLITASETARDFISWPVGYAPYTYWQWCGGDGFDPTRYRRHNFNLQHAVAVGMDRTLCLPWVPAEQATETMGDGTIQSTALTFGTSQWIDSTGLGLTTRYSSLVSAGDDVVGYVFGRFPVATITDNTPITDSGSVLAGWTEVSSIADVKTLGSGHFYIDYDAGVMFVYEEDGDAVPASFTDGVTTITYYQYETSATGSEEIALVTGDVRPGTLLTFDDESNLVPMSFDIGTCYGGGSGDAYAADPDYSNDADADISAQLEAFVEQSLMAPVAQVIAVFDFPRSGLDKVMTKFTGLGSTERMPGTATGGVMDAIYQASGADKLIIVNFMNR